jgi:phenylacetate-CoA ligase
MAGAVLGRLYSQVGRPLLNPSQGRAFRALWRSQWWHADRLRAEQWNLTQRLLQHVFEHVPYYRDVFQSLDARPQDFRDPADLLKFPLLTKQIIQTEGPRLRAQSGFDPRGVRRNHTGGSTGTPLSFWQDATYDAWSKAELDRCFGLCGYRPGQRQAFLWGSDVDSKAHKGFIGRLRDLVLNLRWVDTFDLDARRLREAAIELVDFRPHLMVGYVSSLTLLARLIQSEALPAPRPRAVQTSAEVLTPSARALIEQTLGAPCFDRYGCREVGNIAHECDKHAGLHLLMESNYTEFVAQNGTVLAPAAPGQIVVTNLHNYVMPFIRYVTGDVGVPSTRSCDCGRGLPLMDRVEGRVSDVILTPSGRLLHGEFFTHLFYGVAGIRQFQVEQFTQTDLVVRMVADSDQAFDAARARLHDAICHHGDAAFRIDFLRVPHIPPRPSGKYCFTRSHVAISFGKVTPDAFAG